jgi:hypothetical protein
LFVCHLIILESVNYLYWTFYFTRQRIPDPTKMVHLFSADRASAGQWLAFKQFKSQQFKSALGTFVPV